MDLATLERELDVNRKGYEAIQDQLHQDHADEYAALAQGKLIATAATFDEALAAIRRLQPVPEIYFVFPVDMGPNFEPVYDY